MRIKILFLNPTNSQLIHAGRFGLRVDAYTPDRAMVDLRNQIGWLKALPNEARMENPECKGTLQVHVSDIMPSGFVVHTRTWAVIGLMPARESYVEGPLIEVHPDSSTGPGEAFWGKKLTLIGKLAGARVVLRRKGFTIKRDSESTSTQFAASPLTFE